MMGFLPIRTRFGWRSGWLIVLTIRVFIVIVGRELLDVDWEVEAMEPFY